MLESNQQPNTEQSIQQVAPASMSSPVQSKAKTRILSKPILILWALLLVLLFAASTATAYVLGRRGQKVIIKPPDVLPITLPPEAVVISECVPGHGKRYILPKDIPNGPIYNVKDSKVIAVEYIYKASELYTNPDRLSNTVVPFMKNYKTDHFVTNLGKLKTGDLEEVRNVPIHLTMFVVPKSEAQKITCPKS